MVATSVLQSLSQYNAQLYFILERVNTAGIPFFSPDYRLIPSGLTTAHDILLDVLDFFEYLANTQFQAGNGMKFHVDMRNISVVGGSAGAICAIYAGLYAHPQPKALLSMYGQGGNWFVSDHYLNILALLLY